MVATATFFATAAAVISAGGNPVLMDTDVATLSTNLAEIERRLTKNTVGIMIVHIAGFITHEMPAIVDLAKRKGLWVMEDAAHAHMATLDGQYAGTFGWAGSFSFYPTKNLGALGDGGALVTKSYIGADEAVPHYGLMGPVKAALESATRFLAKSFSAESEVRFNVVGSGPLKTSASAGIPGYVESYLYAEQLTFRKRNLETQEVANTAAFLLSPRSSGISLLTS